MDRCTPSSCYVIMGAVGFQNVRRMLYVVLIWGILVLTIFHLRSIRETSELTRAYIKNRLIFQNIKDNLQSSSHKPINLTLLEPSVDKSPVLSEAMAIERIQQQFPSLPISYWDRNKNTPMFYKNESCARFPNVFDLEFNNIYWQTLYTTNGTFQLFGAYYDNREYSKIGPAIRILGMINRIEPTIKTHCQLWFEELKEPVLVETLEYKYIWNKNWGNYKQYIYQPYLIACQIPQNYNNLIPQSVSIVQKPCDPANNNIRVVYNKPEHKKEFAVCVKGLDFLHDDLSVRLVEWLELMIILGADKVFFYKLQVHPNISKVLNYYEKLGKVEVTPLSLPGGEPNLPGLQHMYLIKKNDHKRQNELIPYNDCLYKNLYTYKYIVLLDIDEVIIPVNAISWHELMDKAISKSLKFRNESRASYVVRNVYFLDDLHHEHGWFHNIPKYMYMLQHVYRSKNFTKPLQYVKCFHNPDHALTLHNNFPLACLGSGCTFYPIETIDAQLQHYRDDCVRNIEKSCEEYPQNIVLDTTIWKYKGKLISRTTKTLNKLGFFTQQRGKVHSN